ncbi:hypothetical protein FA15DRAFT_596034 [Coprinopsis marcescibilis]|uniref:Uncharacterized protein n=1 Tax=Coprinopsis marcescibilis TaxID=230819 RepID=A0A5C3L2U6_COPMA|nr:hypothetical protein FA15DRAFT_596034 [Coprinopsis marcescibilis]
MKQIIKDGTRQLAKTNFGHLLGQTPTTSDSPMLHVATETISPSSPANITSLLKLTPKTTNEALLIAALQEVTDDNERLRARVIQLQAASILNEAHCNMLRFRLLAKEEKAKKVGGKGKLMGDGLPRLLSGDEFYQKVVEFTEWQGQEEARKEARVDARVLWKEAVKRWEEDEVIRKEANEQIKAAHREKLSIWEHNKAKARRLKQTYQTPKPKCGPLQKQPPKPKLKDFDVPVDDEDAGEPSGTDSEAAGSEDSAEE